MPRTRTSLRFKLIVWMIVIWALIQGTLTAVIWLYEREIVDVFFVDRLRTISSRIANEIGSIPAPVSSLTLERVAAKYSGTGLFDRIVLVVYGPDDKIVATMEQPASGEQRLDQPLLALLDDDRVINTSAVGLPTMLTAESRVRSLVRRLPGDRYEGYLLVIEADEAYSRQLGHNFTELLLGSIFAGLLGVAVGATLISGIVTTPIARLSKTLRGMSPDTVTRTVSFGRESRELDGVRRELEAARERMESGFRFQERFISNVAHELRTPIAVLMTEAHTLPSLDDAQPEIRAFVASTLKELRLLGGVVESFLLLSRVREGKSISAATTDYLVNELLVDCVESCNPMAKLHTIGIAVTLLESEDGLDLKVCGVPDLLRTMLDNLVRNAIRFSPQGQTVELAAERHGEEISFTVRDYGPGIPPAMLEHLFERFTQSQPETRYGRGIGLGLAIAKGIADLHDGRISAENCEDGGCRFTVVLPVSPTEDECTDLDLTTKGKAHRA